MPCSDSTSSICLFLNPEEKFISFEYAKITCGREITGDTGLNRFLFDKGLDFISNLSYDNLRKELDVSDEEKQFILYLEFDALRCAIAEYLADDSIDVDHNRCSITNIEHHEKGIEIALIILPPDEMPKILPCGLSEKKD
ncbi:MAG: hypothetical protein ACI9E5_000580 [Candidatus Omnitrophota bacterium]|jgi:hypothetical protein